MPGPAGLGGLARSGDSSAGPEQGLCVSPEVPPGTGGCHLPPAFLCHLLPSVMARPGGAVVASWRLCLTRAPPSLHSDPPPVSHGIPNLCLPRRGTQRQRSIFPFLPALPSSRCRSAPRSPRPRLADPTPIPRGSLGPQPWEGNPKTGSAPPGSSPVPVDTSAGSSCRTEPSPAFPLPWASRRCPAKCPYHIFVTKSTFVAPAMHQTQRTPSPPYLQVPAELGWARPSPSWPCLVPPALLYLWVTKGLKPSWCTPLPGKTHCSCIPDRETEAHPAAAAA